MLHIFIFPQSIKKCGHSSRLTFKLTKTKEKKDSIKYHGIYFASFGKFIKNEQLKIYGFYTKKQKMNKKNLLYLNENENENENFFYFFIQNPKKIHQPNSFLLNFIKAIHKFELLENFQNDSQQKKENAFWEGITSFIKYIFSLIKSNKLNFSIEQFFKSLIQDKKLEMDIRSDFLISSLCLSKQFTLQSNQNTNYLLKFINQTKNLFKKEEIKFKIDIHFLIYQSSNQDTKSNTGPINLIHNLLIYHISQHALLFFPSYSNEITKEFLDNFLQKNQNYKNFFEQICQLIFQYNDQTQLNFKLWNFFNPEFHKMGKDLQVELYEYLKKKQNLSSHLRFNNFQDFLSKIISKFQSENLNQCYDYWKEFYQNFNTFDNENSYNDNDHKILLSLIQKTPRNKSYSNKKREPLQKEKFKIKKKNYSIEDQICENIKNQRFFQNQTDKICLETINSKIHLLIKDSPEFLSKFISEFTQDKCKSFIQNKNVKISSNQNQPKQILEEYFSDMELLQKIPQELISSDHNLSSNLQNYLSNIQNYFKHKIDFNKISFLKFSKLMENQKFYQKIWKLFSSESFKIAQQKLQHLLIYKTICQEFATLTCLNENVISSLENILYQFQKIELSQFKTLFPKFNQEINTRIQIMRSLEIKQSNEKEEIQKNISNVIDEFETSNKIFENAIRFFQQLANELNQSINFFQITSQKFQEQNPNMKKLFIKINEINEEIKLSIENFEQYNTINQSIKESIEKIAKFGKINKEIGENIQFVIKNFQKSGEIEKIMQENNKIEISFKKMNQIKKEINKTKSITKVEQSIQDLGIDLNFFSKIYHLKNWDIFRIYIWEKANNYLKQRQKQKASLQEFQDILVQVIKEFLKYFQLLFSEEQLDSIFNGLSLKNNQNEENIIQNSFQNNENQNQNQNIIQNSFQNNQNQNEENIIQNSFQNNENQNQENIIQNSFQLIRSFYPNLNFDQFKSLKSSFQKILENSNLNNFSELYNFFDKIKTKEFENIKDEFKLIQETIQQRKIEIEIEFEFEIENQNKFNQIFEQYGNSIEETKFFFYKLENEIEVYEIITTLYFGYCKHFPLKENVLICDFNQTKKSDIEKFINIYKFYNKLFYLNQNQNQKYLFSIIHSQRLSKKCSKFLLQELEKINYEKEICFPLIIFFYEKYWKF
ncbi:hypothetical protein M0811_03650 [Anaeramoeba ignava]|uniref:Uncharacterized protein n=1 Tax=Anaeramoeba ignava TaxID=1746090 RepID=A0A9Q0L5G8_ANAIG|nr:hypothetical protein M0811_03650 [Anaeramoeba ignava]